MTWLRRPTPRPKPRPADEVARRASLERIISRERAEQLGLTAAFERPPYRTLTPGELAGIHTADMTRPPVELTAGTTADVAGPWDRDVPSPAELEIAALAADAARRGALGELLLGIPDRAERRELLVWAIRQFVDAPTAPERRRYPFTPDYTAGDAAGADVPSPATPTEMT